MPERESAASVTLHPAGSLLSFGPFRFDRANRILARDQEEIPLPPRVLGVLEHLVERPGTVVSKQALMSAVWKDAFVTETSLTEAVSQVRQLLGDDPQQPTYIQTVHRRGYRFVAPVTFVGAAAGPLRLADRPRVPLLPENEPDPAPTHEIGTAGSRSPRRIWLLAIAVLAASAWVWLKSAPTPKRSATRLAIPLPTAEGIALHGPPALALAPEGKYLVYALARNGVSQLYLRAMDRFESTPIPGAEGGTSPFFSPDGEWIGFFADGKLKKVARSGGAPITLADVESEMGGSWGNDGLIVFAPNHHDGLFRVPPREARPSASPSRTRARESSGTGGRRCCRGAVPSSSRSGLPRGSRRPASRCAVSWTRRRRGSLSPTAPTADTHPPGTSSSPGRAVSWPRPWTLRTPTTWGIR